MHIAVYQEASLPTRTAHLIALRLASFLLFIIYFSFSFGYFGLPQKVIQKIADEVGKSTIQVVIKWTVQSGVAAIPRTSTPAHMSENLAALDFDLSAEDMAAIDALNEDYPYYWDPLASLLTLGGERPATSAAARAAPAPSSAPAAATVTTTQTAANRDGSIRTTTTTVATPV